MYLRGALPIVLCAALALAPAALAAPDATTGGVEVPDVPTGGTEGGAFLPPAGETPGTATPPQAPSEPDVSASQVGGARPPATKSQADRDGDGDVDVEVPVPPQQQPTAPAQPSAPVGGLASTGYAAGLLGLLGLLFGAAGLTLLRMSAPARLRRKAQRRAQQSAEWARIDAQRRRSPAHVPRIR